MIIINILIMIIIGIIFSLKFIPEIPSDFLKTINDMLDLKFIVMLFTMLIPLRSFKRPKSSLFFLTRSKSINSIIGNPIVIMDLYSNCIILLVSGNYGDRKVRVRL